MKLNLGSTLCTFVFLANTATATFGQTAAPSYPQTESLDPKVAKAGTVIHIKGRSLGKSKIEEVYLTDHRFDMKVKVLEQTDQTLTIRVPPFVKPGRLQLLLLTAGNNPAYLEQPLYVLIENAEDLPTPAPTEVSSTSAKPTVQVASAGTNVPVPPAPSSQGNAAAAPPVTALPSAPAASKSKAPVEKPAVAKKTEEPKPAETPAPKSKPKKEEPVEVAQAMLRTPQLEAPPVGQPAPAPAPAVNKAEPANTGQANLIPAPVINQPAAAVDPAASPETGTVPAQLVRRARVNYPFAAQSARIEGAVEVVAVVDNSGHVKDVRVVKGNAYLASAAVASVKEWLYEPARVNGKVVQSEVNIVLNFKRPQ